VASLLSCGVAKMLALAWAHTLPHSHTCVVLSLTYAHTLTNTQPTFITFLLLKVSGIPLAEQRMDARFANDPGLSCLHIPWAVLCYVLDRGVMSACFTCFSCQNAPASAAKMLSLSAISAFFQSFALTLLFFGFF
jgi:hypothetical protein